MGHLSTEEMLVEMKALFSDENSQFNKLSEIDMIGAKLAHTFGDEFILEYTNFTELWLEYSTEMAAPAHLDSENIIVDDKTWNKVTNSAAKLHTMLNEKLISIRDIE